MRVLGIMLFLCLSLPIFAATQVITQIYDVDYGQQIGDEIIVLLKSGQVAKVSPDMRSLIDTIHLTKSEDDWYTFTLDRNRFITAVDLAPPPIKVMDHSTVIDSRNSSYVPTTIADMKTAQAYLREGRHSPTDSQCFNRAIVWTYEWWQKHSLRSQKILIFFTRTYIRRYNFEWWFHIAPYVHVMDQGKVVERVMDVKYTSKPHTFRQWTDIFMRNNAECPVITKYSEYADHPYTGECYIIRTSMYTYQPADIEMNEAWGYTKTSFNMDEVKAAYLEAFGITIGAK